jgi:hypothetical protein
MSAAVPTPLRDRAQRPALLGWLGVGLAMRLALMPFGVTADMLAVWWRSHRIAYDGEVFGEYLVNMGAHAVHAAWLRVVDPVLPDPDVVWSDPWFFDDFIALAPQVVREFAAAEWAPQTLFALKGLYLLADLGAGVALLALVGPMGARLTRRAWAFWMLSPIGLYATYAFGRYEMLAVVLVVVAVLAAERRRVWLAALLLGLAVTMRGYPLLLVPLMALMVPPRDDEAAGAHLVPRQLAWAGLAVVPFAATMGLNQALAGRVGEVARLSQSRTGGTLTAVSWPVDGDGQIYLFVLVLAVMLGAVAGRQWGWWGAGRVPVGEVWVWLLLAHVALFALSTWGAHYVAWLTPFVALAIGRRPAWRGVLWLHLLQVLLALAWFDAVGGPGTTTGTLLTAGPAAEQLGSLRELLLTAPGTAAQVQGVLRTGFVAASALLAAPAVVELWRGWRAGSPDGGGDAPAGSVSGPAASDAAARRQSR